MISNVMKTRMPRADGENNFVAWGNDANSDGLATAEGEILVVEPEVILDVPIKQESFSEESEEYACNLSPEYIIPDHDNPIFESESSVRDQVQDEFQKTGGAAAASECVHAAGNYEPLDKERPERRPALLYNALTKNDPRFQITIDPLNLDENRNKDLRVPHASIFGKTKKQKPRCHDKEFTGSVKRKFCQLLCEAEGTECGERAKRPSSDARDGFEDICEKVESRNSNFSESSTAVSKVKIGDGQLVNVCKYCNEVFPNSHRQLHSRCFRTINKFLARRPQDVGAKNFVNEMKLYECSYCTKTFKYKTSVTAHERVHTGEKPYQCVHCTKTFTYRASKRIHERTHLGEKSHKCCYCAKMFTSAAYKAVHERSHTEEVTYKCRYCGEIFKQAIAKTMHESTHTGKELYKCKYCTKIFVCSSRRKIHERTHTGEKPYQCSYCPKTFQQTYNRMIHERSHTGDKPFKCSFCAKAFAHPGDKTKHERIHTGEKPYVCSYCAKAFTHVGNRNAHERMHTG